MGIPCEKLYVFVFILSKDVQGSPVEVAESLITCINIPQMTVSADFTQSRESKEKGGERKPTLANSQPSVTVPVRSNNAGLTFSYILSPAERRPKSV